MSKYDDAKETKLSPQSWNGYKVVLHYDKIIPCTEKELSDELKASWRMIGKLWMKETEKTHKNKIQPSQLDVFIDFLSDPDSCIQYPNVCKLFKILIATPCNTSCVERGYSFLQMVCAPRRNHLKAEHLETLFLLAALKLPVKDSKDYKQEIEILEKK